MFILGCKQKHPRHFRIEGSGGGWKRPLYRETLSRLPLEGGGRNNADVGAGPQDEQDDRIGRGWHSRELRVMVVGMAEHSARKAVRKGSGQLQRRRG